MKIVKLAVCAVSAALFICMILNSCANLPIKDGGVAIGKDTTAGIDATGIGHVTRQF